MQRLRSVQVLRAVAACAVVFLHVFPDVDAPVGNAGYGAAGVDLFFVISGFIMANVSQGRKASDFLRDRLWRIYPLWWVAVLPWLFILPRGLTFIASSLSLWPIYGAAYYMPVLKVGWTLSFELLFYVGMTVAIATRPALPLLLYVLLLVAALTTSNALVHFLGSPMALEFLMGVAVARLPRRAALGLLIPLGILLFTATAPAIGEIDIALTPSTAIWRALEWGSPAALILWGTISLERLFDHRLFDLPVTIGDASYSVYLFHPLVAYGIAFTWIPRLILAVGLGWVMHVLVERKILASGRHRPTAPAKLSPNLAN